MLRIPLTGEGGVAGAAAGTGDGAGGVCPWASETEPKASRAIGIHHIRLRFLPGAIERLLPVGVAGFMGSATIPQCSISCGGAGGWLVPEAGSAFGSRRISNCPSARAIEGWKPGSRSRISV